MSKLLARNRAAFVKSEANLPENVGDPIWRHIAGWPLAKIESLLGTSMTPAHIRAKMLAEAKRERSILR